MMKAILIAAATILQAYLLGSVDTGILVSKFVYHDDVRNHGSGAAGMTNMLRTFGKKAAAMTATGDVLKGVLAVCIGRWLFHMLPADAGMSPYLGVYLAAIFAVLGHLYPLYFGFKGGKGVLVAAGAILAIQPVLLPFLAIIFLVCLIPTGMVSLGSVAMAALYPVLTIIYGSLQGYAAGDMLVCAIGSGFMSGMVIYMHRANIQRIREGKEYRFGKHNKNKSIIKCPAACWFSGSAAGHFWFMLFWFRGGLLKIVLVKSLFFGRNGLGHLGLGAFFQTGDKLLCRDAALLWRKIRCRMAVRQVGTKGRHKEELAHNKDQGDGSHAEQVFQCGVVAHYQMTGNGIQQNLQTAAGAVLGQHFDELDADHDVKAPLQKNADLHFVTVKQQARHPLDERHSAEQQADEHKAGEQNFQQTGCLNDAVAQLGAPAAFHMGGGIVHIEPSFAKKSFNIHV